MADGVLFDTHVLLWFLSGDERLSETAKKYLTGNSAAKYVSVASAIEVAIKISIGKLSINGGVKQFWEDVSLCGVSALPVNAADCGVLQELEFIHKDSFDRLLVATAMQNQLKIVTNDINIKKYTVETIW